MIIEPDINGGWFIGEVDHLNASIDLTEEWLDEYEHHQGPQHRLRYLIQTGSTDAEDVKQTLKSSLANRRQGKRKAPRSNELREWNRSRRANR